MSLLIKRAYSSPSRTDGFRVLVDRLWPRGVAKAAAKIDLWANDAAPSAKLRAWYHADPADRFKVFCARYEKELAKSPGLAALKSALVDRKTVTLVTAVKDIEHSHVPLLVKHLSGHK